MGRTGRTKRLRAIGVVWLALAAVAAVLSTASPATALPGQPSVRVEVVVDGLAIPWDVVPLADGTLLYTERAGRFGVRLPDGTTRRLQADLSDLFVRGESGLMALAADPRFAQNRRVYTCQAQRGPSVQVVAWTVDAGFTRLTRVADPLVGGIPLVTGRHGGCRLAFFRGSLLVATGDAAVGTHPQDLSSLGGKVLRVDRFTGAGHAANPFAASPNANARLVYTYGHRNVQGLAVRGARGQVFAVEHGPRRDDEVNLLQPGGNYGWNPVPGYDENVPMTDLREFPDAVPAVWSSGFPTLATSGGAIIKGRQWGAWNGDLAVASLKNRSLRIFRLSRDGRLEGVDDVPELRGTFGRLRSPVMGRDGALYITTSNGSNDKILRVTPTGAPIGHLDFVRRGANPAIIEVGGWALDPNRRGRIGIHLYDDRRYVAGFAADVARPDVGAVYTWHGPDHGFFFTTPASPEPQRVCLYAVGAGPGGNTLLGCRTVQAGRVS